MVWIPDEIWYAQQAAKGKGKGKGGGGGSIAPGVIQAATKKKITPAAQKAKGGAKATGQDAMMTAFVSFMQSKGKGKAAQKFVSALGGDVEEEEPVPDDMKVSKKDFHEAVAKQTGQPVTKDAYEVSEDPSGKKGYVATVTVGDQVFTGSRALSKKAAEENAASAAYQALFSGKQAKKGKKRKAAAEEAAPPEVTAKSRFHHAMNLAVGRPLTKADITFDTAGDDVSGYVCMITVVELGKTFQGQAQPSAKLAVENAAEAGLKAMRSVVAPLEEAQAAKKEAKKQEALAMFKEKAAAKKAEKQAAKAAAE